MVLDMYGADDVDVWYAIFADEPETQNPDSENFLSSGLACETYLSVSSTSG